MALDDPDTLAADQAGSAGLLPACTGVVSGPGQVWRQPSRRADIGVTRVEPLAGM